MADRVQLVDTVVRPALAAGQLVITDRHIASTLALQRLDGLDIDLLWRLNAGVLKPDLSVFLDARLPFSSSGSTIAAVRPASNTLPRSPRANVGTSSRLPS